MGLRAERSPLPIVETAESLLSLPIRVGAFFLAFVAMTQAGYLFAYAPYTGIGVFWPAAGLCLATLLLTDIRSWPAYVAAIWIGELIGNASQGIPVPVCITWAFVASGEPLVAALVLRTVAPRPFLLTSVKELYALVGFGVILVPCVGGAIAATASVQWLGAPSWITSWVMWWFGDGIGILVFTPLLVAWLGCPFRRPRSVDLALGVTLVAAMALATEALFGGRTADPLWRLVPGFLTFPLMLWSAMRFGARGVTLAAAVLNVFAAYHTTRGHGMFAALGHSPVERLITLQGYLSFVTLSSLTLAAALAERRRGERQLQDMIDNSTAIIFAKQTDGRYLFVNRMFELVAGVPRDRAIGHTAHELWEPRFAEAATRAEHEVLRTGRPYALEEEADLLGERRTYVSIRFPLFGDDGRIYGICGMSTEITDRKRAEQALRASEERLALVVAATHDAVYDWNAVQGETWHNEHYREQYGEAPCWLERVHEEDRERVQASLDAATAARARTWAQEYRFRKQDGTYAQVLDNAYLLYDGKGRLARMVGAVADITERRAAQEELRRTNLELEHRVERRTAELAAAYREMESFSYSISHDLRSPLRAINGFAKVLLEDHGRSMPAEALEHLARIRAASHRMGLLIDDLLVLSRAGRAEVRHVDVDLTELAEATVRELREAEPTRTVLTTVEPGMRAEGDPGLLRVVLQNLLSNAWKFTCRKAVAHIEVGCACVDGETTFYVKDDGAGFDEAYVDKLFRPFERLHAADEFPGTGIGLATIQRIIHRHGGRVWAAGRVDVGATFQFTLPGRGTRCPTS